MPDPLHLLLIAPEPSGCQRLAWADELISLTEMPEVRPTVCRGAAATRPAVARHLTTIYDCVLFVGHAGPGRLLLSDGAISADWLACMMRQAPPSVVLLSACLTGPRDAALSSLAETLSQSGITTVGMWAAVEDRAAAVYDVEFVRALATEANVATAHRVAIAQLAIEYPTQAGAAFLLPGLVNGYGKIVSELRGIHQRLTEVERKLNTLAPA
jgi:CHAT domain-containing protein